MAITFQSIGTPEQITLLIERMESVGGDVTHPDMTLEAIHVDCDGGSEITQAMLDGIVEDYSEGEICLTHTCYKPCSDCWIDGE